MSQRTVKLTPPRISADHVKEKITCIRAHRERIFRVETEPQGNKLIFHNYGQGGAGWTFLFGCVEESIRQFKEQVAANPALKNKPITVIGAGCYGLLTAIMLKREGYAVRMVAKETEQLPSYQAAGFFFPRARKCSTPQERAIFAEHSLTSYAAYQQIIAGKHPFIKHGPKLLPAYFGLDIDPGFADHIANGLVATPEQVTIDFGNGKQYEAMEYTIIFINAPVMMAELWRVATELGIPITQQEINSFSEIEDALIFNCAGLGAKLLASDARIIPVQGHLITLKDQPPRDELIYYAPKDEGILGITFLRGQSSLTTNQHEFDRLLERCKTYFG